MVTGDLRIEIPSATTGYLHRRKPALVTSYSGLQFFSGDFVAVVGSNGAGKSTLLRTLCGLQPLLSGDILIDRKPVRTYATHELAKKCAIVLTEKVGGFNLRVKDVVASGQIPYTDAFHTLQTEHRRAIETAMAQCGVNEYSDKALDELSDGMFQKTMIARAVAQQTGILLLDEPTAFLDYASRHELFHFLANQAGSGKCVLISTHELDLALRHCTRLLVLRDGRASLLPATEAAGDKSLREIGGGYLRF